MKRIGSDLRFERGMPLTDLMYIATDDRFGDVSVFDVEVFPPSVQFVDFFRYSLSDTSYALLRAIGALGIPANRVFNTLYENIWSNVIQKTPGYVD